MFASLLLLMACRPDPTDTGSDGSHVLQVADTGHARVLLVLQPSQKITGEVCLSDLFPDVCTQRSGSTDSTCTLFDANLRVQDGETGLEVVWAWYQEEGARAPGAVTRIRPSVPPQVVWSVESLLFDPQIPDAPDCAGTEGESLDAACYLSMPHVATWTPDESTWIVADTLNSRVLFLSPPDASGTGHVVRVLDESDPTWNGYAYPNNAQHIEEDGRQYLLVTFKSGRFPEVADENTGRIVMWDITDPDAVTRMWEYPQDGWLAAVHHGAIQDSALGPILLYGHSAGASDTFVEGLYGAVGVARYEGASTPPTYLADLLMDPMDTRPFAFMREPEVVEDGAQILVTDSGCENDTTSCPFKGRVLRLGLEDLPVPALSGAFTATHENQVFRWVSEAAPAFDDGLSYPFEADLLTQEAAQEAWGPPDQRPTCGS